MAESPVSRPAPWCDTAATARLGPVSRRSAYLVLASLALASLLPACARYSTSSGMIGGIRSVAIPAAENQTAEADVAEVLSQRMGDAFVDDGRLRVVDEESADALLLLTVTEVEDRPFTFTAGEQTEQYRFRFFVDSDLVRADDDSHLLELRRLTGWGTYDAAVADTDSLGREPAIEAAVEMVVTEIVDRTTASW